MNKKVVLSIVLMVFVLALLAGVAYAAPPVRLEFYDDTPYQLADCGDFQVINYPEYTFQYKFFFDNDGNLVRVHQLWSGVDVLTNSVTGYAINSPFTNYAVFNETDFSVHQGGVFWHVIVPHEGQVYFQAGQFASIDYTDPNAEISFTGATNLDVDGLCSLLDA